MTNLVQFSCSVMSDSLQPHEPQHARPPCPLPTPRVHLNPCPLTQWCHPIISSSVVPFSSCPQSFPASGSFQMTNLYSIWKNRCYFVNKGPSSQGYGFSCGHVWMWQLDYKESWVPKNWCFWTVVAEKTLESPLHCKEIQPIHPKGDQSWVFIGRTDVETKTNTLATWCEEVTHLKRPLCWKKLKAGRKGDTEDEMVGWHHWLYGHEFE